MFFGAFSSLKKYSIFARGERNVLESGLVLDSRAYRLRFALALIPGLGFALSLALLAILALWLWRFLWLLDLLSFGAWFWASFGVPFGFAFLFSGLAFQIGFDGSQSCLAGLVFDGLQSCFAGLVFLEGLRVCVLSICSFPGLRF